MMQGSLARRLRVLRAERGLTQERAGKLIGVAPETLSDLERGKRQAYTGTLAKISRAYSVPVEELVEEPEILAGKAEAPRGAGLALKGGERALRRADQRAELPATLPEDWERRPLTDYADWELRKTLAPEVRQILAQVESGETTAEEATRPLAAAILGMLKAARSSAKASQPAAGHPAAT